MLWPSYAADVNELQRLAAQRDPIAQFQLATQYLQGNDIEPSAQKAQYWFEQAAESGHVGAQTALIQLYLADTPSPQDLNDALYWLTLQASSGAEGSQIRLGEYFIQYGDQIDSINQALVWYRIAAAHSKKAEQAYYSLLQAQFDDKRLKRVQQLEQLSGVLEHAEDSPNEINSSTSPIDEGEIHTDIASVLGLSSIALLLLLILMKRKKRRSTIASQQSSLHQQLTRQLKISQRTIDKQKQQLNALVKQYKKLQQANENKPSSNQQQLLHACLLFGCDAKHLPDEKSLKLRYRQLSKIYHPDAGGNTEAMAQLNQSLKLLVALGQAQRSRQTR